MIFDSKQFARDLKMKRTIDNDITLTVLSEMIKVDRSGISKFERCDSTPDLMSYVRICEWFGVSLDKYFKPEGK